MITHLQSMRFGYFGLSLFFFFFWLISESELHSHPSCFHLHLFLYCPFWAKNATTPWVVIGKTCLESIFIQVVHEVICHFTTCCAPSTNNMQLWRTLKFLCMWFSMSLPLPSSSVLAVTWLIIQFIHPLSVGDCVLKKFFINLSLVVCKPLLRHPGIMGRFWEVGWSYGGSGGKPREVLLFLMCCRSPTQPPPPATIATLDWSSY